MIGFSYFLLIGFSYFLLICASAIPTSNLLSVSFGPPENPYLISKTQLPPGANAANCKTSPTSPPVVLVHSTFSNGNMNWVSLSPLLVNNARCPFVFNFGGLSDKVNQELPIHDAMALGDVEKSALELSAFVDQVLQETGAEKVDLVGHSQGGMLPHLYIRDLGGKDKVRKFVALSPPNNGTDWSLISKLRAQHPELIVKDTVDFGPVFKVCTACLQQANNSPFMTTKLHAKELTVPQVEYSVIATKDDLTVVPYQSQFLPPGPNVKNFLLQKGCDTVMTHFGIAFDQRALGMVVNLLNDKQDPVVCIKKTTA